MLLVPMPYFLRSEAFKHRRYLVVADGFYEWKKLDETKQPYRIMLKSGEPFAFVSDMGLRRLFR